MVTAADGREALDRIAERVPDLVLTDVMMPRLDGFGLVRALRADRRTAGLPIIVLSARAGEEAAVEGLRTGADDYLAKPFSSEELLARVGAHLELARLRNEEATWRAALIESLQDAFAVVDADGAPMPAARREALGTRLLQDLTMGDRGRIERAFRGQMPGVDLSREVECEGCGRPIHAALDLTSFFTPS